MTVRQRLRRLEVRLAGDEARAAQERGEFGQARALLAQRLGVGCPADDYLRVDEQPGSTNMQSLGPREHLAAFLAMREGRPVR